MSSPLVNSPVEQVAALGLVVLGLVMGSFLNVVIARVPEGLSIVRPGSRCPRCGHALAWYENIPVLSWLALRARCRGCGAPISWRYPAVELLTAALFLACLYRFGWTLELASSLVLVLLLVPLAFIDLDHWVLPSELTLPGIAAGLALAALLGSERFWEALIGAAGGFLLFRLVEILGWLLLRKEAMGSGDKFLLALLGAFLTWKALLGIFLFSSVQGSVVGVLLLLTTGRPGPAPKEVSSGLAGGAQSERASGLPEPAAGAASGGPLADMQHPGEPLLAATAPLQGGAGEGAAQGSKEYVPTMSWEFLAPGLPLWRRLLLLPVSLLLQDIPDAPTDGEGEEVEWVAPSNALPFGPWLALGALEVMLLGPWLADHLPLPLGALLGGMF